MRVQSISTSITIGSASKLLNDLFTLSLFLLTTTLRISWLKLYLSPRSISSSMLCDSVLEEECQKVLLHSINSHLRSSLFYDYLLVSDVLDINDLLDTRSLGMYSACMAPHFPALLCSVYRHCSFPRCYTSHCVCPSLNCVFPTALCCAQITSVVSNRLWALSSN